MKKRLMIGFSVILLGTAAYLFYRTFFSASPPQSAQSINSGLVPVSAAVSASILPYGRNLDFTPIEDYNSSHKQIFYPAVSESEISVTAPELFKF